MTYDHLQNPGSNIGFRGEEKLGGGLSAWFDCQTSADFRGQSVEGLCGRNSALGLKGGFGNFFVGVWDTPFKRVQDNVGSGDTGVFGNATIFMGNSTTTDSGSGTPGAFKRRQRNSINYETPNFSGFTGMATYTAINQSSGATGAQIANKPRLWSLAAKYQNGPLNVFGAYEKHSDYTNTAAVAAGFTAGFTAAGAFSSAAVAAVPLQIQDETGYLLGGSYTFGNNLKLGAMWSRQKFDQAMPTLPGVASSRVNVWHLGIDWMFAGPHGVRAAYTKAGDMKGNGFAVGTLRPAANPAGQTGAHQWQIRYVYAMSKRTEFTAGYSKIDNDLFANYQMGGTAANNAGSSISAFALGLTHKF